MKFGTPVHLVTTHMYGQVRTVEQATVIGPSREGTDLWRVKLLHDGDEILVSRSLLFDSFEHAVASERFRCGMNRT